MKGADETTTPWWQAAFGADYGQIYAHRSDAAADDEVAGVLRRWRGQDGLVLDACCGNGRHLAALRRRGCRALGFDWSADLLRDATARSGLDGRLARADLRRLPFADRSCQGICLFFTAFGYFDDASNAAALADLARVLARGGELMLDLPDPGHLRATLVPESQRELPDGRRLHEERRLSGQRVEKTVTLLAGDEVVRRYTESVRLYDAEAMARLAATAGLAIRDRWPSLRGPDRDEHRAVWWLGCDATTGR